MYEHNLDPVALSFYGLRIYWYSLAYIVGFLFTFWYSKKLIKEKVLNLNFEIAEDFISIGILTVILGGRFGYVFFYNFEYYLINPVEIIKIWKGGMSFHGALIGLVFHMIIFSYKKKQDITELANLLAFSSPVGIFFGRIANFINGELIGKETNGNWGVIYPQIDNVPRHPSQIYECFLEGIILFIILNLIYFKKNYKTGTASYAFLFFYGIFRFISEIFREPDAHIGYLVGSFSMGMLLSLLMIFFSIILFYRVNESKN